MLYHITTYGCQMNVHESEKIAGQLENLGYTETKNIEEADIAVFNTCTIRENAVHKAYGNIGALKPFKKDHKNMIIAVGGCMTQDKKQTEDLQKKFPFVDIIFGTHNLTEFSSMLQEFVAKKNRVIEVSDDEYAMPNETVVARTSFPNAWVNIMYGCNNFCSYCIVPYVRGRERSRPFDEIVAEVKSLLEQGYKEVTLLGQNVNSYGNDLTDEKATFVNLMETLAVLPYKFRLRFMTSHPKDFSEELAKVIGKYDNIPKYIHLPIQSGSNNVLKEMNRRYTREDYFQKIEWIKKYIPNYSLSSDIMVGFPGETEQDFEDTMELTKSVRFSSAFTFVYSSRHGTKAAEMTNQISEEVKSTRIQKLVELQNEISKEYSNDYIGKVFEILVEDKKPRRLVGRTDSGRLVSFPSEDESLIGKFVNVEIIGSTISALKGKFVNIVE
ncbi:MAG: tRNA (N6-isopentenyl adenosine(37)-C2)-methylthiotransferase MiaB [Clostridia bacterium]